MGFSCGIVGLPNAGKSTIFNALTLAGSAVASYAFCTIDPKEGTVAVPDPRLAGLAELLKPPQVTPTTLSFVDIAGLVKNAHAGEGLGNRFLANIREMDAVVHVLRVFEDRNVSHVHEAIDPAADFDVVMTELMLADMETVQRRLDKARKLAKIGDKEAMGQLDVLGRLVESLGSGVPASRFEFGHDRERELAAGLFLLSAKPTLAVANLGEDQLDEIQPAAEKLRSHLAAQDVPLVLLPGKLEMELTELPEEDRREFMHDLGLESLALDQLVEAGYRLLNLVTFYTIVGTELRAWTIPAGTPAPAAAGRIHTDMEQGFIKAEVVPFDQFMDAGSEAAARSKGYIRTEGKEYAVQDGDIVTFQFRA